MAQLLCDFRLMVICGYNSTAVHKNKQSGREEADTYLGMLVKAVNLVESRSTQERPLSMPV